MGRLWILILFLVLTACGPSPLMEQMKQQKANQVQTDSVIVVRIDDDIHIDTVTNISQKIIQPDEPEFIEASAVSTIASVLERDLKGISPSTASALAEQLISSNQELAKLLAADVHEVLSAKLLELAKSGIIIHPDDISADSRIVLTNRYSYAISSTGEDTIIRKDLKWEKKKK